MMWLLTGVLPLPDVYGGAKDVAEIVPSPRNGSAAGANAGGKPAPSKALDAKKHELERSGSHASLDDLVASLQQVVSSDMLSCSWFATAAGFFLTFVLAGG